MLEESGLALDHDGLGFGEGTGDKGYSVCVAVLDLRADPFGSGACLAESSARENEPGVPVFFGRDLGVAGAEGPIVHQLYKLAVPQAASDSLDGVRALGMWEGTHMVDDRRQAVAGGGVRRASMSRVILCIRWGCRRRSGTGISVRASFVGTLRIRATSCVVQPATQSRP